MQCIIVHACKGIVKRKRENFFGFTKKNREFDGVRFKNHPKGNILFAIAGGETIKIVYRTAKRQIV